MDAALWLLCIALAAATLLRRYSKNPHERPPPGPKPLPIVGNIFDLRRADFHRRLAELAQEYGPVYSLRLGVRRTFVVTSADAARDALQKHDRLLAGRAPGDTTRAMGHRDRSLALLPGNSPLWKQHRAVSATHLFSQRSIESTRAVRERKAQELVSELRRHHAGEEIEIGLYITAALLNSISNALFSEDVVDISSRESTHGFQHLIQSTVAEAAKANISDFVPLLGSLDLQGRRRAMARYLKQLYDYFDGAIERRRSDGKSYADFLEYLLSEQSNYDRKSILALLSDLFIGGSDTAGRTVEWAMAELLRNPAKMAKLQEEVRRAVGGKAAVEEADIAELPYLQAVVKETLRLHPTLPVMVPHAAVADGAEIGGFAVPKGTQVIVNLWAIMRDPAAWPEPEEFLPERFLEKETNLQPQGREFEYIPFGSGRRACPAVPLSLRTVPLLLASLVHAFDWKLPEGMGAADVNVEEKFSTTLVLAVPLRAVPVPVDVGADGEK